MRLDRGLRPGVVLLDLNLPGDTGWDLLARRRPRRCGLAARRHHERDDGQPEAASPNSGVAGYLPKPFPLDTLVATIERLMRPHGGVRTADD